MKTVFKRSLAVLVLFAGSAIGFAAPSPIMDMPLNEWNLAREAAIQGGAKSIEQVTSYGGKPSKSKYLITLDAKGEHVRSELVTEGSDKTYVSDFKRNAAGDLEEVTQVIKTVGKPDIVNSRQKATYVNGKLTAIVGERCLTKQELQPEGTSTVDTAADGTCTIDMQDAKGTSQMKITLAYDKNSRFIKGTMGRGTRSETVTLTRNAAGLIDSASTGRPGASTTMQYEMDDKGNWTKVTITDTMKKPDGQEMKNVREIIRKITY
jgi:hypothetical protein